MRENLPKAGGVSRRKFGEGLCKRKPHRRSFHCKSLNGSCLRGMGGERAPQIRNRLAPFHKERELFGVDAYVERRKKKRADPNLKNGHLGGGGGRCSIPEWGSNTYESGRIYPGKKKGKSYPNASAEGEGRHFNSPKRRFGRQVGPPPEVVREGLTLLKGGKKREVKRVEAFPFQVNYYFRKARRP